MTIERLRQLCYAEPFRPFQIQLAERRHVAVKHPDFVGFLPSDRLRIVFHDDHSESEIDPRLVSDVTVSKPPGPKSK